MPDRKESVDRCIKISKNQPSRRTQHSRSRSAQRRRTTLRTYWHLRSRGIEQWDEVYPDHNTIERDVRTSTTFLASNARETVGAIVLNDHQDPEYAEVPWQFMTGRVAVIHRIMIRPTMEGKGRMLMHFAEERALTSGCRSIRLDAFTENPRALRLYERLRYRHAGQVRFRKGYFRCFEKELGGAG